MNRKGMTLVEVTIVIVVFFVLVIVLIPEILRGGHDHSRGNCASNLKQFFTAMYTYSQDYRGAFPQVLPGLVIVGEDKAEKFIRSEMSEKLLDGLPAWAGRSVSQNLWILCQKEFAQPEIFLCPAVRTGKIEMIKKYETGQTPKTFINFPWADSKMTISYSFVQPWSRFEKKGGGSWMMWAGDADPRLVIGADANNGSQPDFAQGKNPPEYADLKKFVNSTNHKGDGQNMLFGDGHVTFEKSAYAGIERDNVYTAMPETFTGKVGDTPGILCVRPKNMNDTVLIPNKDAGLTKWNRRP